MKHPTPASLFKVAGILLLSLSIASPSLAFKEEDSNTALSASHVKADSLEKDDIDRFTNAIAQIKDYYVQQTSDKKLLEDAIRGMLNGLDPHSEYLDEDSYKTLLMTTSGAFGGLGVEVTGEYGVLKVISPIDDTPASKAGIKPGDYIVAINGKLVNEMTLKEAVDSMRGKKGTHVTLTVLRKNLKTPLAFKLMRDTIHVSSIKSNMLSNGFGYVRISEFQEPTAQLMTTAIAKLKKQAPGGQLRGLILDLRNNPGGLLDSAVQVTNQFLDNRKTAQYNNLIVYTEGRFPSAKYSAKATHIGDILDSAPMVLLVNAGSASASEIVAGALQDYHRALVVGINSFGKGSVQTVLPLDDNHAIKLTTALYHTPSGRVIQNKGIVPDLTVEEMKIENPKIDVSGMAPIREYELKGHLAGKDSVAVIAEDKSDTIALAESDFQLYQALKTLKTMVMLNKERTQMAGVDAAVKTPANTASH